MPTKTKKRSKAEQRKREAAWNRQPVVNFRLDPETKEQWMKQAHAENKSLSEWIRDCCQAACQVS